MLLLLLLPLPTCLHLRTAALCSYELRLHSSGPTAAAAACLGGSAMAFCPDAAITGADSEAGTLLVGTESGRLLRCQVWQHHDQQATMHAHMSLF